MFFFSLLFLLSSEAVRGLPEFGYESPPCDDRREAERKTRCRLARGMEKGSRLAHAVRSRHDNIRRDPHGNGLNATELKNAKRRAAADPPEPTQQLVQARQGSPKESHQGGAAAAVLAG